jgi:23S rRNA pseudouridine1911/1915/1917 synthase
MAPPADPASAQDLEGGVELVDELEPRFELRDIVIVPAQHGERLDRVLAQSLREFSRSHVQQLMADGAVQIREPSGALRTVLKPATRVKAGQCFQASLKPTPQSQAFVPQAMPLHIVYEDEHLRIIDKPPGLVVHPAPGNWSGTLLNGLLALDAQAATLPRAGIVHRLDKDTSGLMLVARTRVCQDRLMAMIAAREVKREYLAIAQGAWRGPEVVEVDAAIGRDPQHRLRMAVVDLTRQAGKTARTTVRCLATSEQASWVHCKLHTGRTHQIRVHLSHLGHRLFGDSQYAGPALEGLQRQALHAFRLSLTHPITGAWLSCRADWPADLDAALQAVGLRYNEEQLPALA